MARKIYLVEDELSLKTLLEKYLQNDGYEVVSFSDGVSAINRIKDEPDLWVLDIMLPGADGYEIIQKIKEHKKNTPVIFISARSEELDRVVGLELGSDDYLSKPFLPRELVIRVNKLMERIYNDREVDGTFYIHGYKINRNQHIVLMDDVKISLTHNEFELLMYFIDNRNNVLTREQILEKIWGIDYFGSDRVVDDTIRRLRKKLKHLGIETVYGYGYRLGCDE
ncbi:MAG: response regulator transcription factor [Oscillospiraceae bacterium]|nr:response regulator transcription factor [Oscillospiraceae bacterium]